MNQQANNVQSMSESSAGQCQLTSLDHKYGLSQRGGGSTMCDCKRDGCEFDSHLRM